MLNTENVELCWQVLSKFGVSNQRDKVIEECAELIDAVCHMKKATTSAEHDYYYTNFIEELVDVIVVCQQMLLAEKITEDNINWRAKVKLEKALK